MTLERTYNAPLRREWLKVPKYKRAKRAIFALRRFLARHMKSQEIFIGKRLNEFIWKNGIRAPPHHVKMTVVKEDDGKVYAELFGFKYEKAVEIKEEKKKGIEAKVSKKEEAGEKTEETKEKEKKLEKKVEKAKKEEGEKGAEKEKKLEKLEKAGEKTVKKMEHKKGKEGIQREEKVQHQRSPDK